MPPDELFGRTLAGTVHEIGDGFDVTARLLDPWLEQNTHPSLSRLFGAEPPSPFSYVVRAMHWMNGWTRSEILREGDACFIWIKPERISWLNRRFGNLPPAFPSYPHATLAGFWKARVTVIRKPRGAGTDIRNVRAVFDDDRIREHQNRRVSEQFGHEPWIEYAATLTDDPVREAGGEMLGDLKRTATGLLGRLG